VVAVRLEPCGRMRERGEGVSKRRTFDLAVFFFGIIVLVFGFLADINFLTKLGAAISCSVVVLSFFAPKKEEVKS